MFRTLRSKLIFSYAGLAFLMLVLVFGLTYVFATGYVRAQGFQTLQQKRSVAIPYAAIVIAEQRLQGEHPAVATVMLNNVRNAGLRMFTLNPDTLEIEADSEGATNLRGAIFPFADPAGVKSRLVSDTPITGTLTLPGSKKRYQYIAQRVAPLQWRIFEGAQGNNNPAVANRQTIVVVMQPEPNVLGLLASYSDFLLPALLIGLSVSMGVAFLLARSLAGPISRLAGATTAMGRGDYAQRVPVGGRDEIAALSHQFNLMAEEVGGAHAMQRDFIANISHDLKTPLTSIQGFSQAMLDGSIHDEEQYTQAASIINDEAQRMSRLVSELLSLSQLQSGLQTIELHPIQIRPLLAQLLLTMQPQAATAGVELGARFSAGDAVILGEADRLKQAFGNLIDNALKHTPQGGTITLGLTGTAESVEVTVEDSGQGIPAEDLPRVMERFYQVDKARSSGGPRSLGLGLAIAREIVGAHHGQITISSEAGRGTTVHVTLPAVGAESPQLARSGSRKWLGTVSKPRNGAATGPLPASTGPLSSVPNQTGTAALTEKEQ